VPNEPHAQAARPPWNEHPAALRVFTFLGIDFGHWATSAGRVLGAACGFASAAVDDKLEYSSTCLLLAWNSRHLSLSSEEKEKKGVQNIKIERKEKEGKEKANK
jgi:hypothetical protein